jgi:hypothetical protein
MSISGIMVAHKRGKVDRRDVPRLQKLNLATDSTIKGKRCVRSLPGRL